MKLLVIDDNLNVVNQLRRGLFDNGHVVDVCSDGMEGQRTAETGRYDAIVLEIGLPDRDGLRVCTDLRAQGIDTPLMILTQSANVSDKVKGFAAGADDYLCKPFEFDELLARLEALHRRSRPKRRTLEYQDVRLDLTQHRVVRGEREVRLSKREFDLLALFLRHPDRVLARQEIGATVWDRSFDYRSNVVDVYICSLRRKLNQPSERPLIHTVINCGYALDRVDPARSPTLPRSDTRSTDDHVSTSHCS